MIGGKLEGCCLQMNLGKAKEACTEFSRIL